jgi:hypothetical protein
MKSRVLGLALLLATAVVASAPADAQNGSLTRSFVSSTGVDTNACTITAPCATFAHAYTAIGSNDIIAALDPGKYGPVTVTTPLTIDGYGWAAITAPQGGYGVEIQAGMSDRVVLRGLLIDGGGNGDNGGVGVSSVGNLIIDNCVARNLDDGIQFTTQSGNTTPETLSVSNSLFTGNSIDGIQIVSQGSGKITASIDRTVLDSNEEGLGVYGQNPGTGDLYVAVKDSVASNNTGNGFFVQGSPHLSNLKLLHSQAIGNGTGVGAKGSQGFLWLAQSSLTGNTTGYSASSSGVIYSYGDNYFDSNGGESGSLGTANRE